jgi:hypothetical protein
MIGRIGYEGTKKSAKTLIPAAEKKTGTSKKVKLPLN